MKLEDAIRKVPGIGPKREAALRADGVETVGDFLAHTPRAYVDRSKRSALTEQTDQPVTVEAVITKKGTVRHIRRNLSLFHCAIEDDAGNRGRVTVFNQPWLRDRLEEDQWYYFFGKISVSKGTPVLVNPQFTPADAPGDFFDLTPVYGKIGGLGSEGVHKTVSRILHPKKESDTLAVPEILPEWLRKQYDLENADAMLYDLHLPKTAEDVERGRRRMKFEEALKINIGIAKNRVAGEPSNVHLYHLASITRFENGLPFALTSGQKKVLSEIEADLTSGRVMNRLVQGDVGSGKTIVAVACAYWMALGGYQCAYMAPTEILAQQHAKNFDAFLSPYGIAVTLITGSMKEKERANALAHIENGEAQVIIGTHALFQKDVHYYNLGMVITDEQHRFGVHQRGVFAEKGERPHMLVMSATPIPRTLALVLYGDLDISVIDTMPEGRKPVKTYFYTEKAMPKILSFMAKLMAEGQQGLIVCPFIDDSAEMEGVRDTQSVYQSVQQYYKGLYRVGCLHGKMAAADKQAVIDRFNAGAIDLLVATSIVEVGIDVPNLSVMAVMSAERFGLSQLHQLRGRVGRGGQQAYCFLVSNNLSEKTVERMKVIVNHHDGREIAEADFRLRGPGDVLGTRQHGLPSLSALDPAADSGLIAETKDVALALIQSPKAEDMRCVSALSNAFDQGVGKISMN